MTASSNADADSPSAVRGPPRPRGPALGRPPVLVWLLTGLHALLLLFHSVLVPTWRGPDEPNHVDVVIAVTEDGGYPAYDERLYDPGIRRSLPLVQFKQGARNLSRSEALPRPDRPSRAQLREPGGQVGPELDQSERHPNHMSKHPPGYYLYLAAGTLLTDALTPGSGLGSYDREVGVMRVLSLVLIVPLPLLAWATARVAGASAPASVGAAIVPLGIPQLTHIGSVVNNDALLLVLMGALTLLAVRFATGHVTRHGVVAAGTLTGLALLTKAFAFVIPLWVGLALALGVRRSRRWSPVIGGYLAVAFVTGGWWWAGNLLRYGQLHPSIEYAKRLAEKPPSVERDLAGWLADWPLFMSNRFWGSFGWVEVPLPNTWTTTATAVVLAGVAAALVGKRRPLPGRAAAALVAPGILLAAFVFLSGFRLYRLSAVAAMVQGRYLFGGVVGISVLAAAGLARLLGRRVTLLPALLLLAAAAMQLRGVAALLGAFWGEPGAGTVDSLAAAAAWSPWPPWLLVGMAVVGAATVVATGVATLSFARTAGAPPAD